MVLAKTVDSPGMAEPKGDPVPRQVTDDVESYPWWKVHPRLLAAALAVLLIAAGLATYHYWPQTVYITDGGYTFNSNLSSVEAKIKAENDWVASSGKPFVTIAVAATMSPQPAVEPLTLSQIRHGIEGAYLAQYESNHPAGQSGRPGVPLIKLVLADLGSQEASWQPVATGLQGMVGAPDNLVAVTGLGISVTNTLQLVGQLERIPHGIGMVGSVLTGTKFAGMRGLVLISPTTADQASAAARLLDDSSNPFGPLPSTVKILIVQDQNANDDYAQSLGTGFASALATASHDPESQRRFQVVSPGIVYDSSLPDPETVLAASSTGDSVCHTGAQVVYFAGRAVDLQGLLTGLAHRYCQSTQPLIVLTGSDAAQLSGRGGLWPSEANMTVYYTGLTSPDMWSSQPDAADQSISAWFGSKYQYGFQQTFPGESLNDSWAIMYFDGMLTAVDAVQALYTSDDAQQLPSAGAVAQQLNSLTVHGASGYICFNSEHDPVTKAIPVLQLGQNGQLTYVTLTSAAPGSSPDHDPCPS
jgi:hypothetical protein